jgi:hypothetical protein
LSWGGDGLASGAVEGASGGDHRGGGEVEDAGAGAGAEEVSGYLGCGREAEHSAIADPEAGGHWGDVRGEVFVEGGDKNYWGAPVEDRRGDCLVHGESGVSFLNEFLHLGGQGFDKLNGIVRF